MTKVTPRRWRPLSFLVLLALGSQLWASASAADTDRLQTVKSRGTLIVGVKYDSPGYGWLNPKTGIAEGFEVDLARYIGAKIVGSPDKVRLTETGGANRIPYLKQGDVDIVVAAFTVDPARRKEIDFSNLYFPGIGAFMVSDKGTFSGSLRDLRGKNVCMAQGSYSPLMTDYVAQKFGIPAGDYTVSFLPSYNECFEAVKIGRVDAVFGNLFVVKAAAELLGGVKAVELPILSPWAVGVAKGNPQLVGAVNSAIDAAYKDGTWATLYRKWTHADPPKDWHPGVPAPQ